MNVVILGIVFLAGFCLGIICFGNGCLKKIEQQRRFVEKYESLFQLMCRWTKNIQEEQNIAEWFEKCDYRHIAIYGMGVVGRCMMRELEGSKIVIDYVIDLKEKCDMGSLTVYKPTDILPEVDCIIVTPIANFDEIEDVLRLKLNCPIISLEDVIYVDDRCFDNKMNGELI